jgi:hypothetical protein
MNFRKHSLASFVSRAVMTLATGAAMLGALGGCAAPAAEIGPRSAPSHAFGPVHAGAADATPTRAIESLGERRSRLGTGRATSGPRVLSSTPPRGAR